MRSPSSPTSLHGLEKSSVCSFKGQKMQRQIGHFDGCFAQLAALCDLVLYGHMAEEREFGHFLW